MVNLDENGAGFSSKDMFQGQKADIEFVQVRNALVFSFSMWGTHKL